MSDRHSVILASAGSGKTYELAGRYIRLLAGATTPDRILALTFTRKAAGEMLARVCKRLLEGAKRPEARQEMAAALGRDLSEAEARKLLLSLLRRVGSARVQTLDSFQTQAVRCVAPDLGLPPGWRVMDEAEGELVVEDALDRLFDRVDVQQLSAVVERMLGEMPLRPYEGVRAAATKLHEGWIECPHVQRWGLRPVKECDADHPRFLAAAMLKLPPPLTPKGKPDTRLLRKLDSIAEMVEARTWRAILRDKMVESILSGKATYYSVPIPEQHLGFLVFIIESAQWLAVGELADQSEAAASVAAGFDAAIREAKQARCVIGFDDLARLLLSGGAAADPQWLAFRLDSRLDHVLLDEFQDTSRSQYLCLEPILREITSQEGERSVFVVGDVKQSLYGWRSAVPDLLPILPERLSLGPAQTRARNWRSSPAVLEAVNAVFQAIADNPVLAEHRRAAQRWAEFFQPHVAAKTDLAGEVRIEVTHQLEPAHPSDCQTDDESGDRLEHSDERHGEERTGDAERHHIDQVAARVEEIHTRHPQWTIAVLLRTSTNNRLTRYARALKRVGIDAAEDRGFPLTAEPAVNAVLSLLQLAEHPGDSAAGYHVANSAVGRVVGLTEVFSAPSNVRCAARVQRAIAEQGLEAVLRRLRLALVPDLTELGVSRLIEMERRAARWDADPGATLAEFIGTVEQSAVVDPVRARVSVMTIHHAKGLEFDAVVLPELNRSWKRIVPKLVIDRGKRGDQDPLAPVERVTIYPAKELQSADPRLAAMAQRYWDRVAREELSCLYVAMTRAIRRLDLMLQPVKSSPSQPSAAAVLRETKWGAAAERARKASSREGGDRQNGKEQDRPLLALFEHSGGQPEVCPVKPRSIPARPATRVRFRLTAADVGGLVAPSAKGKGALVEMLTSELVRGRQMQSGEVWHYAFETIEWRDAQSPRRAADLAAAKFRLSEAERARLASQIEACFCGAMGALFEPNRYAQRGGRPIVLREWPFASAAVRTGAVQKGMAVSGRIDRLVVGTDGSGSPLWAEIIDFKVQLVVGDPGAAAEAHRAQLDAYRAAVGTLLKLETARVSCVVGFPLPAVFAVLAQSNQTGA